MYVCMYLLSNHVKTIVSIKTNELLAEIYVVSGISP